MAARAGKTTPPASAPQNLPPNDHNQGQGPLTQEDLDDLFLVHLAQARMDEDAVEKAMEAVRAVKKIRTRNRVLCRTDGFPLTELDNILKDELLPRHEVEEREEKRLRMRGVANQPGGSVEVQQTFMDSFAKAERDASYWQGHGLTAGLRGMDQDPTKYEVPQEHHQAWLENWHDGQKKLAKAWETKRRIEGGGAAPAAPEEAEIAARPAGMSDEEWDAAAPKPPPEAAEPEPVEPTAPGDPDAGGAEAPVPAEEVTEPA